MGRGGGGGGIGRGFMVEKPTRPIKKGTTRRVMAYFRPYRAQVALVLFAILIAAILGLATPLLLKLIIDDAILKRNLAKLTLYAGLMIAVPLVTGLINVGQTYLNNLVGQRVMRDLRNRLYEHLQAMSLRFFSDTRTGEIQSRLSNDVGGVQNVITNTATSMVSNVTTVASTIVAMLITSWQLTIIALFFLPLFLYLTYRVGNIRREISRNTQRTMADMSALVEETLSVSGVLLTKTFGRQQQSLSRFQTENQRLADLQMRQQMVGRWFFMMIQTFFSVTPAVVYYVAGRMILGSPPGQAAITIGGIVTFTTLQRQLFFPIGQLLTIQVEMQAALALFDRIFEYLDMPIEIADRPNAIVLDPARVRGDIEFDHVSFRYDPESERPALDDVSFHATPGQLVALVGPSGAGKTTISYLLTRLYDAQSGAVLIDGIDVRDVTLESLAEIIGVVTQETYLFHASIRENLAFAKPNATDKELMAAVRAANIEERILEMPDGLDTIVGERGYRMSGGEKQRLAIARVVLKNPRILVLDEATSALDSRSERLIQAALRPLMQGRTTVAIAHRLSTILAADQILVVEGGRIVERGTHAALLARGNAYARLYHEQFQDGRVEAQCEDGVVESSFVIALRNRTLLAVSSAVGMSMLGIGMVVPVRVLYAQSQGASLAIIGAMASAFLLSNFIFQYPVGWLADMWGKRPTMMAGLIGSCGLTLLYLLIPDPLVFVGLRFIEGIFSAAVSSSARALLADEIRDEERGRAFGVYGAFMNAGFLLGPALGGLLATYGYAPAFIMSTVFRVLAVGVVIALVPHGRRVLPEARAAAAALPRSALWTLPLIGAYILFFGDNFYFGFDLTLAPLWLKHHVGATVALIGLSYAVWAAPNVLLTPYGGRVADRMRRSTLILIFGILQIPCYVAFGFLHSIVAAMVVFFIHGTVYAMMQPAVDANLAAFSPPAARARAQGLYSALGTSGAFIAANTLSLLYGVKYQLPLFVMAVGFGICVLVGGTMVRVAETRHRNLPDTTSDGTLSAAD